MKRIVSFLTLISFILNQAASVEAAFGVSRRSHLRTPAALSADGGRRVESLSRELGARDGGANNDYLARGVADVLSSLAKEAKRAKHPLRVTLNAVHQMGSKVPVNQLRFLYGTDAEQRMAEELQGLLPAEGIADVKVVDTHVLNPVTLVKAALRTADDVQIDSSVLKVLLKRQKGVILFQTKKGKIDTLAFEKQARDMIRAARRQRRAKEKEGTAHATSPWNWTGEERGARVFVQVYDSDIPGEVELVALVISAESPLGEAFTEAEQDYGLNVKALFEAKESPFFVEMPQPEKGRTLFGKKVDWTGPLSTFPEIHRFERKGRESDGNPTFLGADRAFRDVAGPLDKDNVSEQVLKRKLEERFGPTREGQRFFVLKRDGRRTGVVFREDPLRSTIEVFAEDPNALAHFKAGRTLVEWASKHRRSVSILLPTGFAAPFQHALEFHLGHGGAEVKNVSVSSHPVMRYDPQIRGIRMAEEVIIQPEIIGLVVGWGTETMKAATLMARKGFKPVVVVYSMDKEHRIEDVFERGLDVYLMPKLGLDADTQHKLEEEFREALKAHLENAFEDPEVARDLLRRHYKGLLDENGFGRDFKKAVRSGVGIQIIDGAADEKGIPNADALYLPFREELRRESEPYGDLVKIMVQGAEDADEVGNRGGASFAAAVSVFDRFEEPALCQNNSCNTNFTAVVLGAALRVAKRKGSTIVFVQDIFRRVVDSGDHKEAAPTLVYDGKHHTRYDLLVAQIDPALLGHLGGFHVTAFKTYTTDTHNPSIRIRTVKGPIVTAEEIEAELKAEGSGVAAVRFRGGVFNATKLADQVRNVLPQRPRGEHDAARTADAALFGINHAIVGAVLSLQLREEEAVLFGANYQESVALRALGVLVDAQWGLRYREGSFEANDRALGAGVIKAALQRSFPTLHRTTASDGGTTSAPITPEEFAELPLFYGWVPYGAHKPTSFHLGRVYPGVVPHEIEAIVQALEPDERPLFVRANLVPYETEGADESTLGKKLYVYLEGGFRLTLTAGNPGTAELKIVRGKKVKVDLFRVFAKFQRASARDGGSIVAAPLLETNTATFRLNHHLVITSP